MNNGQRKNYLAEFNKLLNANCYKYHTVEVFRDFCRMATIALSNPFYGGKFEEEYTRIEKNYDKESNDRFKEMFRIVVEALQDDPHDFLGDAFMSNDMGSSYRGQFFTPQNICDFMAELTITDIKEQLKNKEFITLNEPACGAGAMVIAAIKKFINEGLNHSKQLYVVAQDVDPICADMAYVQLSLLGVAAKVVLGDTLAMTCNRVLATPIYFVERWNMRLERRKMEEEAKALLVNEQCTREEERSDEVLDQVANTIKPQPKQPRITPSLFEGFAKFTSTNMNQAS